MSDKNTNSDNINNTCRWLRAWSADMPCSMKRSLTLVFRRFAFFGASCLVLFARSTENSFNFIASN